MPSRISTADKWLYEKVGDDPNPIFALPSSLNWIKSLSFEVSSHHGSTVTDQIQSLRRDQNLARVVAHGNHNNIKMGDVFGSLYSGITYTLALKTLIDADGNKAWVYPSAIINWYYAVYNSLRSINLSQTLRTTDTHSGMVKALNEFSHLLPNPFDMIAEWQSAENYSFRLPSISFSGETELIGVFREDQTSCRGMIVKYLKGTSAWEMDYKKEELKKKHRLDSFRSAAAKAIRDQYCLKKINFLNCAFRYRGKANYRDTLFLTYGVHDARFNGDYLNALFNVARFLNLTAMEFQRRRLNSNIVNQFQEDISRNLRHGNEIQAEKRFWELV